MEQNMKLKNFEYFEYKNQENYWALDSFELGKINLLTAKNATGKTRTLQAIHMLTTLILDMGWKNNSNFFTEFDCSGDLYSYYLQIDGNKIIEKLTSKADTLLIREESGMGEMFTKQFDRNMEFQMPKNKLAISRRDLKNFPYLESFYEWANNVRYFSFGSSMNQEFGKSMDGMDVILDGNSQNSVEVFAVGELEFDIEFKSNVLSFMNKIGYDLTDIDVKNKLYSNLKVRLDDYVLFAHEKDRNTIVTQNNMSQGMFRALSIIIHITYHIMMQNQTTILIDDIGEGLDFDRTSKLINLLIELAEQNENIQLIMSTNDRFVMNNVPLEYWQVIQRTGGECKIYNYKNSKDIFDEFAYTGLNNFDFLASDFINSVKEVK